MRRGLLQEYAAFFSLINRIVDVFSVFFAGCLAYLIRFHNLNFSTSDNLGPVIIGSLLVALVFPFFGLYESWRGRSLAVQMRRMIFAWFVVMLILFVISIILKTTILYSRLWILLWIILGAIILIVFRVLAMILLRKLRKKGWNQRKIIIIGKLNLSKQLVEKIEETTWAGLMPVLIFASDLKPDSLTKGVVKIRSIPDKLASVLQKCRVDEIWLAFPLNQEQKVKNILFELRHITKPVRYVPDVSDFSLLKYPLYEVAGMPVLDINSVPLTGFNKFIKVLEDYVLAVMILILSSPVLAMIAIGVKLSSKGSVLFKQLRHGSNGKPIIVYKFRTMKLHDESPGQVTQAKKDDDRITPFGKFLRKTSLDELPQFINVLQGRMSIVGPRPHAIEHNEFYKDQVFSYMQRHKVKPGITGWAQVNGYRGETDTLTKMQKRVEYDLYYIDNWSIWFDFEIIFLTIIRGFGGQNAY